MLDLSHCPHFSYPRGVLAPKMVYTWLLVVVFLLLRFVLPTNIASLEYSMCERNLCVVVAT